MHFYVFESKLESSTEDRFPCLDLGFSPISRRLLHINRLSMLDRSPMYSSTLNIYIYLLGQL